MRATLCLETPRPPAGSPVTTTLLPIGDAELLKIRLILYPIREHRLTLELTQSHAIQNPMVAADPSYSGLRLRFRFLFHRAAAARK